MSTNHAGQFINTYLGMMVPNVWLRAHGFPEHSNNSIVNPSYTPQIRPHSGAFITIPLSEVAWAPDWNQERLELEWGVLYPTIPLPGSQTDEVAVSPSIPPIPITVFQPPTAISIDGIASPYAPLTPGQPKMALKKVGKNKIYNTPLCQIKRLKGGKKEGEIGLEIECEGMNLVQGMVDYWLVHQDNSLRHVKEHPPQEYVLREPLSRKDIPKALKYLKSKLAAAKSELVYSHRTSVHVHLNCQSLTIKEIYQIWCLYTIFEELLVEFSGPDRPGNLFCLSSKQAEYQVFTLQNAILTENFEEVFNDNLRYTSCNVASLGKFGSLEFRSMRGTVDIGLIQTWIDLLCIIKDKALEYSDPQEIVKDFQSLNSEGFLKKIFGGREDIYEILRSYPDRHKKMWDGLRLMRDVAYAIEWEKKTEDKDQPKKEDALEAFNLEATPYIPGVYKIYCIEEDIEDIQEYINESCDDIEGFYWLVNYTEINHSVARLNPDGTQRAGSWIVYHGNKALYSDIHLYLGQMNATQQEIEIGQQFA